MSKSTEVILIILAAVGVALAIYNTYQISRTGQTVTHAAQNPLATVGSEIERWFDSLWGSSVGGTPETSATS